MGKVLVIDAGDETRESVVAILEEAGHVPLEATDGGEALAIARRERPDVVISDILMPTMDGYRFASKLRSDPEIAGIEIIIYTVRYREHAARNLANDCGISWVLVRPCEREEMLAAVDDAIQSARKGAVPAPQESVREQVRKLVEKLARKSDALRISSQRLAAAYELNLEFASESDPRAVLQAFCRGARDATGARYAVLGVRSVNQDDPPILATSGIEPSTQAGLRLDTVETGALGRALKDRRSRHFAGKQADPIAMGLPSGFPKIDFAMSAPLVSGSDAHGWICMADKLGESEFDIEDELFLTKTAAQVGRIYQSRCAAESTLVELATARSRLERRSEGTREAAALAKVLTNNEREIIRLVAAGKSTAEAAEVLGLSPRTVETYRARLMEKVGVESFAGLVKFAVRSGLATLD